MTVYPACAGIDLWVGRGETSLLGLPRMRGDRPLKDDGVLFTDWFTPHARGSTLFPIPIRLSACVYPACAGIDL